MAESTMARLAAAVRERARGRSMLVRAPLLALAAWTWVRLCRDAQATTVFSGIDLGIHEAGHLLFSGCGRFLMVAGGTLLQLAAPLLVVGMFLRQRDDFGACFAVAWFGVNLNEVAVYLSDARAQVLPLVTVGGGEAAHDWTYLLGRFGVLQHDLRIGALVRGSSILLQAAAIVAAGYVLWAAAMSRSRATASATVAAWTRSSGTADVSNSAPNRRGPTT